ncbi:MAG: hypothetical protein MRJ65_05320 [Candidatus Brocadiaceae bacterium]|nr:hypothetical protein [Candidatus Brocadiaceae bacterium]
MNKINTIDMVRSIRDTQYEITKEKSPEELKAYFHQEAKKSINEINKLSGKHHKATDHLTNR